jgi:hypothetical protein
MAKLQKREKKYYRQSINKRIWFAMVQPYRLLFSFLEQTGHGCCLKARSKLKMPI